MCFMPNATVTIEVGEYNGTPGFIIDHLMWQPNELTSGEHEIVFEYKYGSTNRFKMFGKQENDTLVDNDNNILADKFILIKKLRLDYMEILNWQFYKHIWNPYFAFNNQSQYLEIPNKEDLPLWYINLQNW